jgi:hypothetical protein
MRRPAAVKVCGSPHSAKPCWRLTLRAVRYLAELYIPASSALADVAAKARAGAEHAAATGAQIRFLQAIFVPQDESCFVLYQAGTPDEVSTAGTFAGLVFDRIMPAICEPAEG